MKKIKKYTLYLTVFLALNLVCKKLTDDFSTDILLQPASKNSSWASFTNNPPLSILNQPYRYLGKGKQAFVFVSEDGEHVLKLFKPPFPPWTISFFGKPQKISLSKLPFLSTLLCRFYAKEYEKQKQLDFQSYVNSFTLLQEETQVEYLHLTQTDCLKKTLTIYDKIGILHHLDLDSTCFILQKKTDLLYPTLQKLITQKDLSKAKKILEGFVSLSYRFIQAGIIKPTTVEKNIGCLHLTPIHIDVGRVLTGADLQIADIEPFEEKLDYTMHHMRKWLKTKNLELASYLEEIITTQKTAHRESHDTQTNNL